MLSFFLAANEELQAMKHAAKQKPIAQRRMEDSFGVIIIVIIQQSFAVTQGI
jgi:hypothetical protein